ncbi:MAG: hypothetical protein L0271_20040, partial [Gemmatimonadetes bacterium]|nr:hypothetical protein [Gemmatimonadota bacterium]
MNPGSRQPDRSEGLSEIDPSRIRTVPVARRPNKVEASAFAKPPGGDAGFHAFLESLPDLLEAHSFIAVVDAIATAARDRRGVVCMIGGHVIKAGLAPLLTRMMERRAITHLASNGSAVIHDYEMARWGGT